MTSDTSDRPRSSEYPPPRAPGEAGVWVFVIAEMVVFTVLFVAVVWDRGSHPDLFAHGQQALRQPLGLINTIVLITGSVLAVMAVGAADTASHRKAARLLMLTMGCGVLFAIIKAIEYLLVLEDGNWIHTNSFWMLFFAVTGAHLVHVFVGVTVLGLARTRVVNGLVGIRDRDLFVSATCYWHLVDLLWLVIFPLFYLVN